MVCNGSQGGGNLNSLPIALVWLLVLQTTIDVGFCPVVSGDLLAPCCAPEIG